MLSCYFSGCLLECPLKGTIEIRCILEVLLLESLRLLLCLFVVSWKFSMIWAAYNFLWRDSPWFSRWFRPWCLLLCLWYQKELIEVVRRLGTCINLELRQQPIWIPFGIVSWLIVVSWDRLVTSLFLKHVTRFISCLAVINPKSHDTLCAYAFVIHS